ncbi:MAG: hypothetical protein AAF581_15715 [Planctomycetota bacterium]
MNDEYKIELKATQYEYLTSIAKKYDLDDPSKAVRCLINFAIEESDHEASIYEDIRCMDC